MKKRVRKLLSNRYTQWVAITAWVILSFVIAIYGGGVLIVGVAQLLGLQSALNGTTGLLTLQTLVYVIMLILLVAPLRLYRKNLVTRKDLGVQRELRWRDIGLGLAGYVIYFLSLIAVTVVLTKFVPAYNATETQELGFTSLLGTERLVAFFVFVVVAPVVEELIMRGFLFGKLRQAHMPYWPAAILVSLLFGFAHGQWNVAVDTFLLSMVACYLREKTGTIWPGVIIHITKNMVAYMFLFVFTLPR